MHGNRNSLTLFSANNKTHSNFYDNAIEALSFTNLNLTWAIEKIAIPFLQQMMHGLTQSSVLLFSLMISGITAKESWATTSDWKGFAGLSYEGATAAESRFEAAVEQCHGFLLLDAVPGTHQKIFGCEFSTRNGEKLAELSLNIPKEHGDHHANEAFAHCIMDRIQDQCPTTSWPIYLAVGIVLCACCFCCAYALCCTLLICLRPRKPEYGHVKSETSLSKAFTKEGNEYGSTETEEDNSPFKLT